jgi:hypothetical protein
VEIWWASIPDKRGAELDPLNMAALVTPSSEIDMGATLYPYRYRTYFIGLRPSVALSVHEVASSLKAGVSTEVPDDPY